AVLALTGRPAPLSDLAARFIGVGFVAALGRSQMFGPDLIQWWQRPDVPRWLGALALIGAATVGVGVEIALWTASRSRTWRISWLALVRADLERSGAVGAIMTNVGALMAFAYPAIGVWALPLYLVPIATAVIALRRAQRIRDIQHQLITALSRLSDETGHTNPGHAQRVARLSVALGEELGLGPLDLLAVRDAALVHDVGQVTLAEPIPDGATLGAAPAEQAQVVLDTVRIIEAAGLPEPMVEAVRGSIVQFRQLREQGQTIPVTGRIVKVANAYDDLTRGRRSARAAALERIHLGLGYEYDPAVVDALARVTENA
ncbi:MAG TPA: HD domain-containing protein, partial [Tetrasphaera sp.]